MELFDWLRSLETSQLAQLLAGVMAVLGLYGIWKDHGRPGRDRFSSVLLLILALFIFIAAPTFLH